MVDAGGKKNIKFGLQGSTNHYPQYASFVRARVVYADFQLQYLALRMVVALRMVISGLCSIAIEI